MRPARDELRLRPAAAWAELGEVRAGTPEEAAAVAAGADRMCATI